MEAPPENAAPSTAMEVDQTTEPPVPQPTIAVSEAIVERPQIETETAAQPATEGHRPPAVEDLLPPAAYGLRPPAAEGPHPPAVEGLLPPAAYGSHTPADVSMAAAEDPGAALSRATSSSFASPAPKSPPQRALTPVPPPDDGAYCRKLAFSNLRSVLPLCSQIHCSRPPRLRLHIRGRKHCGKMHLQLGRQAGASREREGVE